MGIKKHPGSNIAYSLIQSMGFSVHETIKKERKLKKQRFLSNFQNGQTGEVIAIGGGKEGIGKSFLTANLGIHLAKTGKQIILIDGDLASLNLHTRLGMETPQHTLSDYIQGKVEHIKDLIFPTGIPNLTLISGGRDFLDIAKPYYDQKMRLIRMINQLDFDYILVDAGEGTTFNILDFFIVSDNAILVVLPQPDSIENTYRFIKKAFYRKLKKLAKNSMIRQIIQTTLRQKKDREIKTPYDLLNHMIHIDERVGRKIQREMLGFTPKIVVNQVRFPDDMALGFSFRGCCSRYFGINVDYLGYIDDDPFVIQSMELNRPLMTEFPYASSARCVEKISHNLLKNKQLTMQGYALPQVAYR